MVTTLSPRTASGLDVTHLSFFEDSKKKKRGGQCHQLEHSLGTFLFIYFFIPKGTSATDGGYSRPRVNILITSERAQRASEVFSI